MGQSSNTRARPGPNILHHWCYLQEELDPPLKTSNGPFASVLKPIISYLITDKKTLILLMKFLVFIFVKCQTFILDDPKAHVLPGEVWGRFVPLEVLCMVRIPVKELHTQSATPRSKVAPGDQFQIFMSTQVSSKRFERILWQALPKFESSLCEILHINKGCNKEY